VKRITKVMKTTIKPLTRRAAWKSLAERSKQIKNLHLRELFTEEAKRGERFTEEAAGLFLDYSKNRLTDETLKLLLELAEESNLPAKRDPMFSGENINLTENRAVLHVGLRAPRDTTILVDGKNVVPEVYAVLEGLSFQQSDGEFDAVLDASIQSILEASTVKQPGWQQGKELKAA
jgi:glucose-6-phosphate isomerase